MPLIIMMVMAVLGVVVVLAMVLGHGRSFKIDPDHVVTGTVDPLSLTPLGQTTAKINFSVPDANLHIEAMTLVVNLSTRPKFLQYGPKGFTAAFTELAFTSGGYYLTVAKDGSVVRMPLDGLRQKLFGHRDILEVIELIHDMTEVNFISLEADDEAAVEQHSLRCGFDSLDAPSAFTRGTVSQHTIKM